MARPADGPGRRIAVIGCGERAIGMAIGIATESPADVVAGFDRDPAAVASARRAAARAGVADRVTFEVAATLLGDGYDLVYLTTDSHRPLPRRNR